LEVLLLVFVAPAACCLGVCLLVAPSRATRALHEWYIVPPAVQPGHRVRLFVVRLCGALLIVFSVFLAVSFASLMIDLS
jgi:hypothetical protein